jgi:hypothetical protein
MKAEFRRADHGAAEYLEKVLPVITDAEGLEKRQPLRVIGRQFGGSGRKRLRVEHAVVGEREFIDRVVDTPFLRRLISSW